MHLFHYKTQISSTYNIIASPYDPAAALSVGGLEVVGCEIVHVRYLSVSGREIAKAHR